MARIEAEIAAALPELTRAVFSQPTAEAAAQKLTVRPLLLKGERVWQVEKLTDNKAFHRNLGEEALLALIRSEAEGFFRQVGRVPPGPDPDRDGEPTVRPQTRRQL